MKELNFEQMENIQGGVNCFLTGLSYVLACASGNLCYAILQSGNVIYCATT